MIKVTETLYATLYIVPYGDVVIGIREFTDTGTRLGEIFVTSHELPMLIKALQEIQAERDDEI